VYECIHAYLPFYANCLQNNYILIPYLTQYSIEPDFQDTALVNDFFHDFFMSAFQAIGYTGLSDLITKE
jgi:hypothetical protein